MSTQRNAPETRWNATPPTWRREAIDEVFRSPGEHPAAVGRERAGIGRVLSRITCATLRTLCGASVGACVGLVYYAIRTGICDLLGMSCPRPPALLMVVPVVVFGGLAGLMWNEVGKPRAPGTRPADQI